MIGGPLSWLLRYRAWKKEERREQPRVSVPLGVLGLVGTVVFYLAANIPRIGWVNIVLFGALSLFSLLCGITGFTRQDPPRPPPRPPLTEDEVRQFAEAMLPLVLLGRAFIRAVRDGLDAHDRGDGDA